MIRIALLSDIHFGRDGRGDFTIPYNRQVEQLNAEQTMSDDLIKVLRDNQPEYLFIAGDLTSIGSPVEYHYMEKMIIKIANGANIDSKKIIWCVGNHDNDWNVSQLSDKCPMSETGQSNNSDAESIRSQKYKKLAASVVDNNIEKLPRLNEKGILPASGVYSDEKIVVFVLNSCSKCMHDMEFDHGEISAEQLAWFKKELQKYSNDKKWKIVLLHHHPFNYAYPELALDISQLSDGSEFQEIAGKGGVHLVLHGHRHHPRCKTQNETGWKNPISFVCSGSLSVREEQRLNGTIPNMFHIIDLEEGEKVGQSFLRSFEYLPGTGWEPSTKRGRVVPIDATIRLGMIKTEEEIKEAIERITISSDPVLSFEWSELEETLQFNSCEEINRMIETQLNDRYYVKAKLPENLTLKRREQK